jgi:hypothetical protein
VSERECAGCVDKVEMLEKTCITCLCLFVYSYHSLNYMLLELYHLLPPHVLHVPIQKLPLSLKVISRCQHG